MDQTRTEHDQKPNAVCSAVTYLALFIILLLAIPVCVCIALIGVIWRLADKVIRAIE